MFIVVADIVYPLVAANATACGQVIFDNLCLPALVKQEGESNSSDFDCKLMRSFMAMIILVFDICFNYFVLLFIKLKF